METYIKMGVNEELKTMLFACAVEKKVRIFLISCFDFVLCTYLCMCLPAFSFTFPILNFTLNSLYKLQYLFCSLPIISSFCIFSDQSELINL